VGGTCESFLPGIGIYPSPSRRRRVVGLSPGPQTVMLILFFPSLCADAKPKSNLLTRDVRDVKRLYLSGKHIGCGWW
jgi:hypothetical protein